MFFIAHLCVEVLHSLHCFSRGEEVGTGVGVGGKVSGIEVRTFEASNILVWFGSLNVYISPC
jgi:hypothetical protein